MKLARFLFTVVGLGALTLGVSYAGEPSRQPEARDAHADHAAALRPAGPVRADGRPMESNHSELKNNGHTAERSNPAGPIHSLTKPEAVHTQTKPAPLNGPHQFGAKNPAIAAREGHLFHETTNPHEQLARSPTGNQAVAPRPGVIRSRGLTSANVGKVLITSNARYSGGPLAAAAREHNR